MLMYRAPGLLLMPAFAPTSPHSPAVATRSRIRPVVPQPRHKAAARQQTRMHASAHDISVRQHQQAHHELQQGEGEPEDEGAGDDRCEAFECIRARALRQPQPESEGGRKT